MIRNDWMKRSLFASLVALGVGISGCSGGGSGGGSGSVRCDSITGGGAEVSTTGPVSNANAAADGDLYSAARLNINASSQSATVRATAQTGIVFPAGSFASVFVTFNNQGGNVTLLRTYLEGALVETANPVAVTFEPANGGTGAELFLGFRTNAPFDALEFFESDDGSSGAPDYRVYEICSDAAN